MPKFRKIIKDIQKDRFVRLGDIAQFSKETSDYSEYESGEFKYLEISGVSLGLNKYRTTTVSVSNAPSRAKMKTQDGDIVIALTRPHRGAIAQIKESGVISSTGFSVIRKVVTQIDREWLLFVLLSNLSLQQMLQRSSGGNYPAIIEDEVKRIYIPIVDYSKQLQMAANMRTKAKEFDAQIQTSNSFLNNTLFILERVGLTFDKDNNNLAFAITRSIVEDRIDADYYSPRFVSFRNQIEQSRFPAIPVGEISEKIVSGFAAGKQDQADDLPEDQRVPHLRPFSITPEGELSFETKKYVPKSRLKSEDYCKKNEVKPFRRVDGNHRLLAIEKLIAEGQMRSNYLIPFCIIVFPDNVSMKDEKIIFHNINSKAVPIRSERLLEGIIVDSKDELSFSDKELDDSFGHEYLLARKVLKNKPLAIRKLKAIPWIRSDLITALIDIIESIQKRFGNIQTAEHEEAFGIALS